MTSRPSVEDHFGRWRGGVEGSPSHGSRSARSAQSGNQPNPRRRAVVDGPRPGAPVHSVLPATPAVQSHNADVHASGAPWIRRGVSARAAMMRPGHRLQAASSGARGSESRSEKSKASRKEPFNSHLRFLLSTLDVQLFYFCFIRAIVVRYLHHFQNPCRPWARSGKFLVLAVPSFVVMGDGRRLAASPLALALHDQAAFALVFASESSGRYSESILC